jgi:DnaJ homolog subfamily A member 2
MFRGEAGSDAPDLPAGDLIFVLEEKPHPTFKRVGGDLLHEHTVSLVEALTGAHFFLKQLDDRVLEVSSQGHVIKPDSWMVIRGEGMPVHGRPYEKGNLYIHFDVEFPKKISEEQAEMLRSVLGAPVNGTMPMSEGEEHIEKVTMAPVANMEAEIKARRQYERTHATSYESDSDEEGMGGGQRVACAQQ